MLIRELAESDHPAVLSLLQQHTEMPAEEQTQLLERGRRLVALQGDALLGVGTLAAGRRPGFYSCGVLVAPDARRQGTGSQLWAELLANRPTDARLISCFCPATDQASQSFLRRHGFQPWYGLELMHYSGPAFPESGLVVRGYQDADYDDWIRLINEGFFPMRQAMDIQPNLVYPDEVRDDPATRQKLLGMDPANSLLFFDEDRLIGMGELEGTEIDTVTVDARERRKGYGRRIIAHCTNLMLARGINPVTLHVVSWNAAARQLYESMGWRFMARHDAWRLQLAD